MSLLLVRHGQASFAADDYDQLSDLGARQSRRLGAWLAEGGHRFSAVVVGGMRRHRQTHDAVAAAFAERGIDLPAPLTDPGLDEFDHRAVFGAFIGRDPGHPLVLASRSGEPRAVGALLHAALQAWAEDSLGAVPETWDAFGQRVRAAGQRIAALAAGGEVLVLSSGGVISRLAQAALEAPDHRAIDLNLSLRNSAQCEFRVNGERLHLSSWNALPHLHDARELWTYY